MKRQFSAQWVLGMATAAVLIMCVAQAAAPVVWTFDCDIDAWTINQGDGGGGTLTHTTDGGEGKMHVTHAAATQTTLDSTVDFINMYIVLSGVSTADYDRIAMGITVNGVNAGDEVPFVFVTYTGGSNDLIWHPGGVLPAGSSVVRVDPSGNANWNGNSLNQVRFDLARAGTLPEGFDHEVVTYDFDWIAVYNNSENPDFVPAEQDTTNCGEGEGEGEGEPLIADDDLVAYYSFDSIGSVVADGSGNGYDGTVNGTITAVAGGKRNGAGQFASTAFLDMDGPNIADADIPTSGFTLAAWCNVEDTGSQHAIFNARSADDTFLIHPEIRPSNGDYRLTLRGNGSTKIGDINAGTPVIGEWVHYCATYNKSTSGMTLYINGQSVGNVAVGALENAIDMAGDWDNGARVGYNVDDARPFTGLMDEFYIFKRALSAVEVQTLYTLQEPSGGEGDEVVFRFDCDTEGFGETHAVSLDHTLGWMIVQPTDGDPYTQVGVSIAGNTLTEFGAVIEVQDPPDANPIQCAMYWFATGGHGRAPFTVSDGPNIVRFNVPATKDAGAANWDDSVTAFRLDLPESDPTPLISAGTTFLVDAVAFSASDSFVPDPWTLDNDCDNDGLSNDYEAILGTDPKNPDSDGDGVDDGIELEYGSDPTDPDSTVQVPATSHVALALLALLLAAAAVVLVRRRARVA